MCRRRPLRPTSMGAMDDVGPVFAAAPPERIDLDGGVALMCPSLTRVPSAVAAINRSLDHLRPWMDWAQEPATEAAITALFATAGDHWDQRRDFPYSIVDTTSDEVVGGSGLHARLGPHGLEIGYWVHVDWVGRGIASAAARALTAAAFAIDGIEQVRIQCAHDNVRSARIPAALGFRLEEVGIPEDGPCAGRLRQRWGTTRDAWVGRWDPPGPAAPR